MNKLTKLLPGPEQRKVYRSRTAVVRKDAVYGAWKVSYRDHEHERILLPWPSWEQAMRQALNWTGLDL